MLSWSLDSEKLVFGTDEGLFSLDLTAKQDGKYLTLPLYKHFNFLTLTRHDFSFINCPIFYCSINRQADCNPPQLLNRISNTLELVYLFP